MKNVKKILMLAVALSVLCALMCVNAFAAEIESVTAMNGIAGVTATVLEKDVDGVDKKVAVEFAYSGVTEGNMYLVLILEAEGGEVPDRPTAGNILYVNQTTADSDTITFDNLYPSEVKESYIFLAGADEGIGMSNPLAKIKPAGVEVSGTAISWNDTDDASYLLYSAETSDADIKADLAKDAPEKALAYSASKGAIAMNADNKRYDQRFTFNAVTANATYKLAICKPGKYVPKIMTITVTSSGVTEDISALKLWLYGDVNEDGEVTTLDSTQILRSLNYLTSIFGTADDATEAERLAAANVVGDALDTGDSTQILRYINYLQSIFDTFK